LRLDRRGTGKAELFDPLKQSWIERQLGEWHA
jgi:hypothetical protein